jgi:hypothetical protein
MVASKKRWLKQPGETLWRRQLVRLHTLWGLFCRQSNLDAKDRAARLEWVAGTIGRPISSFGELSADEANTATDAIQKQLPSELVTRKRPSRRLAQAYGTAGRRSESSNEIQMVDGPTSELLDRLRDQLGWSHERLDSFLKSKHSPIRSGAIRTLGEANRVVWVLKSLLRRGKHSASKSGSTSDLSGNDAATLQRAG